MDFDLEIIDEEGDDCPDPLFDCIMNAMNSMKEATADKIYQKIQKEGEMNYSKPQVDRALASALKYGIFEVRNNRYRVRDDILDDEDTVYWKLHKDREQTPFRIQEDINDKQSGPKLDPEKDNQRFRRTVKKKSQECPHCGKAKKPEMEMRKFKTMKKAANSKKGRKPLKKESKNGQASKRKTELKRKGRLDLKGHDRYVKKKKLNDTKHNEFQELCDKEFHTEEKLQDDIRNERNKTREKREQNTMLSEMNFSPPSDYSFESFAEDNNKSSKRNKSFQSQHMFECRVPDLNTVKAKHSSISVKTESNSEKTDITYDSDNQGQGKNINSFFENVPCTSKNTNNKIKNQGLSSSETYNGQYENSQTDHCKEKSDWLGCSDEPQGTIIQSNNVLTIEPMDSLALKSPEQASYIS